MPARICRWTRNAARRVGSRTRAGAIVRKSRHGTIPTALDPSPPAEKAQSAHNCTFGAIRVVDARTWPPYQPPGSEQGGLLTSGPLSPLLISNVSLMPRQSSVAWVMNEQPPPIAVLFELDPENETGG
jgi:hypothetical protein